jgi:hypothetical protein
MANFKRASGSWKPLLASMVLVGLTLAATADRIVGQQPMTPRPMPVAQPAASSDANRPAAYIYDNIPVSYEEFGRFLMDRGGTEKLELFVNKRIIEEEARKANVTVSKLEMEAALMEDLEGIQVKKSEFVQLVLPKYGKTLYEWMEDVIRPRILLMKMCRNRIQITDADLKLQFERRFGEQRQVQMIMWPKTDDAKAIQATFAKIRDSQAEFDHAARSQANPSLAAACGYIKPITKHLVAEDKIVEQTAFALKVGEVSHVLQTQQGWIVMKLHKVIPPNTEAKFDVEKARLEKAAFDERLTLEVPKYFAELKIKAKPQLLFTGPAEWRTVGTKESGSVIPTGGAVVLPPAGQR